MRKPLIFVLMLLFATFAGLSAADETAPTVTITNDPVAIPGEEFVIDVIISGAYIENSTFEVDTETSSGWGPVEQAYFDFSISSYEIEKMESDETVSFSLICQVSDTAAEKQYTIPLVFYGKSGECDSGCVPFRTTHSTTFSVMDPQDAQQQEEKGNTSFDEEKYSLAKIYYQEARSLYSALGNDSKVAAMDEKISDSETGILASQLYDSGKSKLSAGNKEGALTDFTASKENYEDIGNTSKVSELEELIESCQPNDEPPPSNDGEDSNNMLLLAGLGIIIAIVIIAIVIKYK